MATVVIRIDAIGQGPPLVLLHGWAMHGGIFASLLSALQAHRTLYVVDLPGHGDSPWHDGDEFTLPACAEAIAPRVPEAPWVGWSLGGLVALHAALGDAANVTGVVALATTARFIRAHDWPHAVDDVVLHGFAAELARDHRATLHRFLALEAHGSDHLRDDLRFLQQQVASRPAPHPRVLADGLAILRETDFRKALASLALPSLWIGGRRDRLVPWRGVEASAALVPDSASLCIAHAGHAPFLSHADEVARSIREWLDRRRL